MAQDNRLLPLGAPSAPLDRPLRELTQPERPNNTYGITEPAHLRDYMQVVLKRKWLILSLVVVVTSLAAIQMYRLPSEYEATTTIQIEQKNRNLVRTPQLVLNAQSDPNFVGTQLKLLESPSLARKVILRLDLLNNPDFLGGQQRPGLLATVRRIFSREKAKEGGAAKPAGLAVVNDAAAGAAAAEPERSLTPEQAAKLEVYEDFLRYSLSVDPVERTSLVNINFRHSNPEMARRVTDALAQVFKDENYQRETEGSDTMRTQVGERVAELQLELKRKQEELIQFRKDRDLPLGTVQGENLAAVTLTLTSQQMLEAENKRKEAEAAYQSAQTQLKSPEGVFSIPQVQADASLQKIREKLNLLEEQDAALSINYTALHPERKKIEEQKSKLHDALRRQAGEVVAGLKANYDRARSYEQGLTSRNSSARSKVKSQSQDEARLRILDQEMETTKQMYNTYLQKQKELEVNTETPKNISITTAARTPRLVGPARVRNIMIALLLSLAAGVGLAFLLDYLDDTLKTIEDVDRHVHLPTLALIPASQKERKRLGGRGAPAPPQPGEATALALIEEVRSPVAEAYRHLRTSLLLSSAGQPPKSILVTSSQPSEGKTTTAVNIAVMLAQTGAEVLLLDCDLRRPRIHMHFGMANARGVTNYLSGELQVSALVQQYDRLPNLKVITSGPVPPNAAELLGSDEMRRMLHVVGENFQHVIIDSPPAISFTDASILSTMVDGVMLVVHGGRSSRAIVRRAKQQLLDVGAHIFGIVLNNVRQEGGADYYYPGYYSDYYAGDSEAEAGEETLAGTAK